MDESSEPPSGEPDDPTVVRSVAVTASDAIAAVEAHKQRGATVVLRVTPPFSGRMRARLHVDRGESPADVYVEPTDLFDDSVPAYPDPADTEDQLRTDPAAEYTVDRHRELHEQTVEEWRTAARDHFVDEAPLRTPDTSHPVTVTILG